MKNIILGACVVLFFGCTSSITQKKLFEKSVKTKQYYSLKEYKEKKLKLIYSEYLELLNGKKVHNIETAQSMPTLVLASEYKNFKDIVNNKDFFNKYPINKNTLKNLKELVYCKNKAIAVFTGESALDNYSKCFYVTYYLLTVEKNKLKIVYLDGESGEIVIPH
jgi:Cu2+-containing amine oxidase